MLISAKRLRPLIAATRGARVEPASATADHDPVSFYQLYGHCVCALPHHVQILWTVSLPRLEGAWCAVIRVILPVTRAVLLLWGLEYVIFLLLQI